jgi:anti-sigma B factor antagonist
MTELAVVEARVVHGAPVVSVRGEVDLSNAHEVMAAIDEVVSTEVDVVVVDLSETAYLDSSGIAILFRLGERLDYRRQELRLVVPPRSPIRTALELTRLPDVIAVQDALSPPGA